MVQTRSMARRFAAAGKTFRRGAKYAAAAFLGANALYHGYNYLKAPAGKIVNRKPTRRYQSSGIVGTLGGKLPRKFGLRKRRYKKTTSTGNRGIMATRETGGVLAAGAATANNNNTLIVGHSTTAAHLLGQQMFQVVLKMLLIKADQDVSSFTKTMTAWFSYLVGSVVSVRFLNPTDGTFAAISHTFVGSDTFEIIANALETAYRTNVASLGVSSPHEATLIIPPASSPIRISLQDSVVNVYCKSDLKLQNRTVEDEGDDTSEPDKIPLSVRGYSGFGNGTIGLEGSVSSYSTSSTEIICDNTSGAISKIPQEKYLQEIQPSNSFVRVRGENTFTMNPGVLKTSVLYYKKSIRMKEYLMQLYQPVVAVNVPGVNHLTRFGKFRFFMFEKVLNATVGTAQNALQVAYEHNLFISTYITTKRKTYTVPLNSVCNIADTT